MSGVSAIADGPPVAKANAKQRFAEAQKWLDALPSKVVVRHATKGHAARLVMYRTNANTPEFWEKLWVVSPCFRMRGYKLPRWYKDVFTRRLPRRGLVVEAGCGNGNLARMLANEGIVERIEGLDFAPDVIAENQRIHPPPEGSYRVGDVRNLPFEDGSVAAYLSMGVVEHFDEDERATILREAARCLRPGGVAVVTVPSFSLARRLRARWGGFEDERQLLGRIEAARSDPDGSGQNADANLAFYQFYFTLGEIRAQVEAAGLRVVEVDGYDCKRGWLDAFGRQASRLVEWIERRGKWFAERVDQPPKVIRRFCPHMLMLVAEKPG
jgi:SAM-dependent methyltransferase